MGKRDNGNTSASATDASETTPITRTRKPRATTEAAEDFDAINVRFPKEIGARLDAFTEELKIQAPWTSPSRADAVRALVMKGLPPAAPKAPVPPPLTTPGYVGPGERTEDPTS
jgi:hypothetical protein